MLSDRLLALLALAGLVAFIGVLVIWVPRVDLIVVALLVVGLATWDFYRDLGPGRR